MIFIVIGILFGVAAAVAAVILTVIFIRKAYQTSKLPVIREQAEVTGVYNQSHYRSEGMTGTASVFADQQRGTEVYYQFAAEFRLKSRKKLRLKINRKWFSKLREGDKGILSYKGQRFIDFTPE